MKVKELIAKLLEFDQELEILVEAECHGYASITIYKEEEVVFYYRESNHHLGTHEKKEYTAEEYIEDKVIDSAIILGRYSK